MKKLRYITYTICMILLASCSSDEGASSENTTIGQEEAQHEISIYATVDNTITTRATVIDNDNIGTNRIHIDAYKTATTESYINTNALKENGTWEFFKDGVLGLSYFWPPYALDFFAYSPYQLDKTNVSVDYIQKKLTYAGTSPITLSSQASQPEFVYAYTTNKNYADNGNKVALTFHHPFSLVDFKLDESVRCTIQNIKITGIKNNGTCTLSATSPYAAWNTSGDNTYVELNFAGMSAYSENGGIRYPEDVNSDSHLGGPFIVVPQTLDDASLIEVTYKAYGSNSITVQSKLNKAVISGGSTPVTEWSYANKYTYSLKLNGAADELWIAVAITPWTVEGNTETEVQ